MFNISCRNRFKDTILSSLFIAILFNIEIDFAIASSAYTTEHTLEENAKNKLLQGMENVHLSFRKNEGQWNREILYKGSSPGWSAGVYFMKDKLVFGVYDSGEEDENKKTRKNELNSLKKKCIVWNMTFIDADKNSRITTQGKEDSHSNYLLGNSSRMICNVPDYKILTYHSIYKNVDVRYYSDEKKLKYDYILNPGSDINDIKIACGGIKKLIINDRNELEITTAWGILIEELPESYQLINGSKKKLEVKYKLYNDTIFGFTIQKNYNPAYPVIIDPVMFQWSTFVGGATSAATGYLYDMAVDALGNVYATGHYTDLFPMTPGSYDESFNSVGAGSLDVYVFKLKYDGTALDYATYIGGSFNDVGSGIAVNSTGEAFVTGRTASNDFPMQNAYSTVFNNIFDAFVLKLNAAGNALIYSTYIGGTNYDSGNDIAVNTADEAFITGSTFSGDFPVVTPYDASYNGGSMNEGDIVVFKLSSAGNNLLYSTYVGGNDDDGSRQIIVNNANEVFVAGFSVSNDFPTVNAYDASYNGGKDIIVFKLNNTGNSLIYSTYIGDIADEFAAGLAINTSGEAYLTGATSSSGFPMVNPYDASYNGGSPGGLAPTIGDVFVATLNSSGNNLLYSTFIGGSDDEEGQSIGINSSGDVFVTGYVVSADFPTTCGVFDTSQNSPGQTDIFVFKLDINNTILRYSSYFGGNNSDYHNDRLYVVPGDDCEQQLIVGLTSHSPNFPTTAGVFQQVKANLNEDQPVIFRLKPKVNPGFVTSSVSFCANTPVTFTDTTNICGLWGPLTSWQWDFDDGTTSTSPNPIHTYTASGTYNVKLVVSCPKDSIIIPVIISGVNATINPTISICSGGSILLTAGGGVVYNWNTGASTSSITVTPSATTNYTVTISDGTCSDTKTVIVNVKLPPVILITGNNSICEGDITTLTASGALTYIWNTGVTSTNITMLPVGITSYTITGSDNNGCIGISTITVTTNPLPVADAGSDEIICAGETVLLSASGGSTYLWNTGAVTSTAMVSPAISTIYTVTVSNGNCANSDKVTITVINAPVVNASNDVTIGQGENTKLSASGGENYLWHPSTGLSCITCYNPTASPQLTTIYKVTITDANGCTSIDTVTVVVEVLCKDIFIPNAFSPNEDGENDEFRIFGSCIKTMYLKIYNRWGENVFETDTTAVSWDGNYNKSPLNSDVFVYSFEAILNNEKKVKLKGNILLIR